MRWLYLHFYNLHLDSLMNSEETNEPMIIVDANKNEVVQLNSVAMEMGFKVSMGLATALALNDHVKIIEYQTQQEHNTLVNIADALYQYSADIALLPPQGLCLNVTSMTKLYGSINNYWAVIIQALSTLGYSYSYAFSTTPMQAQLLAKTQYNQTELAHLPTNKTLLSLPIANLPLTAKLIQSLQRIGIRSLGQLLSLPAKQLSQRFDKELISFINQLDNQQHNRLRFHQPQAKFYYQQELAFEVSNSQYLLKPITQALKCLLLFLTARSLTTLCFIFSFTQRDHGDIELTISSALSHNDLNHWLQLVELKLEPLRINSPVLSIKLECNDLQEFAPCEGDLFFNPNPSQSPAILLARLQAKLGEHNVHILEHSTQFHPELASSYTPATKSDVKPCNTDLVSPFRPSYLFFYPVALTEPVELLLGPERLQTQWWSEHYIHRDYFIAKNKLGVCLWVFKTPEQHWFVHGVFS